MKKFSIAEAVEKRRIIPFSNGPKLARKELEAAEEAVKAVEKVLRG